MASNQILKLLAQQQVKNYKDQQFTPPEVSEDEIAKYQADFDSWKASQSKPKSSYKSAEIPQLLPQFQGGYVAQSDARRDYSGNSALERAKVSKEISKKNDNAPKEKFKQLDLSSYNLPKTDEDILGNYQESQARLNQAKTWVDPSYRLSKEEEKQAEQLALEGLKELRGIKKADMTPEQLDRLNTYLDLQTKTHEGASVSIGAAKKALDVVTGLGGLIARGLDSGVNQNGEIIEKNGISDKYNELMQRLDERISPTVENAKQNAFNYGAGQFATNAGLYMLTNPLFDNVATGLGATGLANFGINQAAQAGQDVALDILPTYEQMTRDGSLTDDEIKSLAKQFGWDVVGNLALGLGGEVIKRVSNLKNAERVAQANEFTEGISKRADELAQMNAEGYKPPVGRHTAQEIASLNQNPVDVNNSQFSNLMDQFNGQFKDDSAMRNIYTLEDIENAQNNQFSELMKNRPKTINDLSPDEIPEINTELPDIPSLKDVEDYTNIFNKSDDLIPNITQNVQKTDLKKRFGYIDLPEDVSEKGASDFAEIYEAVEAMNKVAKATGDEKVLAKFDKLAKAVNDYEDAFFKEESEETLIKAKKAADAARQSFIREVKKSNPNYTAELTGTKLGNAAYRRTSMKASEEANQELADYIIETDKDLNRSTHVQDAVPETQNPFKEVNEAQIDSDWEALKAGENQPKTLKMNLQQFEGPTSRADKMVYDLKYGEGSPAKAPETKVSEFYNNSMQRNKFNWDDEDLETLYRPEQFEYLPTSEKTSVKNAFENVKANRESLIDRYTKQADTLKKPKEFKKFYDAQDVDQMHLLIRDLRKKALMTNDPAQKAVFDQQRFEITKHLYDATHSSAKVMQAGQKWLNDADGILDTAESLRLKKAGEVFADNPKLQKEANRVAEDIYRRFKELEKTNVLVDLSEAERKAKLRQLIDDALSNSEVKRRLGQEDINKLVDDLMQTRTADGILQGIEDCLSNVGSIKDETVEKVYDIWSEIETLDPGSKQFQKEVGKIYALLANDIGGSGTFGDKIDAWRYFSMLANPTTHIRNILGNITMNGMTGIKNNLAAAIEGVADKGKKGIQGGRTKAILTLKDKNLLAESGKYFDEHAYGEYAQGGNRYLSASLGIDDALPTFKTKALDNVVKGHSNLLSAEDVGFGKAKYKTSLAGYLKANGADESIFKANDAASKELLERANKYALEMANEATFHTENAAANALSQFTRNLKASDNPGVKALGIMIDTTIPFKKTPMNILKNCFEYSPVEFGKVIMDLGNWKKGVISTSKMIDNLSKAVTGTGGMAIGALLAHEGIIKVTNGSSKETSYDKQSGQQSMALNILGHDIDISFLPPSIMPIIMGATLLKDYEQKYGDKYTALDVIESSLTDPELIANTSLESLDTIVDTTMLSGVNDMINTIRYADEPQDIVKSLAAKTATNYASQMIPTLAKKTASVMDGQTYSSYSDKAGAAKTIDSSLKYLKTTIPGLQKLGQKMEKSDNQTIASIGDAITAEPKINGWGEEVSKEDYGLGVTGRAIDQYLNPATTTKNSEDKTTKEIRELSKRLNDENVLSIGTLSSSEAKVGDTKLNEKQWTEYSKTEGKLAKELADFYVNSDNWKSDADANKAETLSEMKSFAKAYAQNKVAGKELSSTNAKLAEIYEKSGAEGVTNYITGNNALKASGIKSTTNAGKEILAAYESGDTKKAEKLTKQAVDMASAFEKYGVESNSGSQKAFKEYGEQGVKTYKKIGTRGLNIYGSAKSEGSVPSLDTFTTTYSAMDNYGQGDKKGDGTVNQEEFISYITAKGFDEAKAQEYAQVYGDWKTVPVLQKDGSWKFKKVK